MMYIHSELLTKMINKKRIIIVFLSLFCFSVVYSQSNLFSVDTCFIYNDPLPLYFKSQEDMSGLVEYHPCDLLFANGDYCLIYNQFATNSTSLYYFNYNYKVFEPKGVGDPFIFGAFIQDSSINTINIKFDTKEVKYNNNIIDINKELRFFLNNKFDLLPKELGKINFVKYDGGLKKYNYDIEKKLLNYLYRDSSNICYHNQLNLETNKIIFKRKYDLKYNTNKSLKYLYYFDKDSLISIGIMNNLNFKNLYYFQEGYRLVSVNGYPVIFDRVRKEIIINLTSILQYRLKLENSNLIEGNPVSSYSDFTNLYLLIRETNSVYLLKYKFAINVLKIKRNAIFAKYGRIFKTKELQKIFNQQEWYKPNPNYSDEMLTEEDKKEIKRLLELEKNNNLNLK